MFLIPLLLNIMIETEHCFIQNINHLMTLKQNFKFSPNDIKSFIAKGEAEGVKFQ